MKNIVFSFLLVAGFATIAQPIVTVSPCAEGTLMTSLLQKAIDDTSKAGGGIVRLEKGTYLSDGLGLKSNVTLQLDEGCRLEATTNVFAYARGNAFVCAFNATNVAIVGKGVIDGHGEKFEYRDAAPRRPHAVDFIDCVNVRIEGVTLTRPASWTCRFLRCDGVVARNVTIRSNVNFNNDGFDIEARNVLIENCDIDCDDDAICFKSDTRGFAVENCVVRNCKASSACNFVKFGTAGLGTYRNILVENIDIFKERISEIRRWDKCNLPGGIDNVPNGIAAFAVEMVDGGVMENVTIRNCTIRDCQTPFLVTIAARSADTPNKSRLENVTFENIRGTCMSRMASSVTGLKGELRPKNIVFRNIDITYPGGATEKMAAVPAREPVRPYPENRMYGSVLPAWGFYLRHADGVHFENVNLRLASADARKDAVIAEDCSDVTAVGSSFAPVIKGDVNPACWIDPFIGTLGTAHCYPSACVPFGFVQAGPSSGTQEWKYTGGYQFDDSHLYGFVQNAISGTGVCDLGDLLIQPFRGSTIRTDDYRMEKSDEVAAAGYYSVRYRKQDIMTEVTAAPHVAMYSFNGRNPGKIKLLVDQHWGTVNRNRLERHVLESETYFPDEYTMTGHNYNHMWVKRHYFFAMKFNHKVIRKTLLKPRSDKEKGARYVLEFDSDGKSPLKVKIAMSSTSIEAALANLKAEAPGFDFVAMRDKAYAAWGDILRRINVEGTSAQKTAFYTSLYHLCIQPNNIADVGQPEDYGTLSLWDTFRAAHPFYTLLCPEMVTKFIDSMMTDYSKNGFLSIWTLWDKDNQCMIGTHSVPVMVDAYFKGFKYDWEKAYAAIRDTLRNKHPNRHKENWDLLDKHGYYPFDGFRGESVSRTLECNYDDWCAAKLAKALGHDEDADFFMKRAQGWKLLFDKDHQLMRGRNSKGEWRTPFDPVELGHGADVDNDFTEGNSWQYTWHVMQDPEGLISMFGGKEPFVKKLDELFNMHSRTTGYDSHDVTGLIGQYAHGNEPSHHTIYFFQYADRGDLTAKYIREVCDKFYLNKPDGLSGNDDCGQMSAWYLFSSMGFYPFNPCGGDYVLGAPQIPMVKLNLANGKTFTVRANNLSTENKYVKSVSLNGRKLDGIILRHADIMAGGELVFEMTSK